MKRRYKLPIKGIVIMREPLTGAEEDPICVVPIIELVPKKEILDPITGEKRLTGEIGGFSYSCLSYNIDEEWCEVELEASSEFHEWLLSILPQLKDIQKEKGWKLEMKWCAG